MQQGRFKVGVRHFSLLTLMELGITPAEYLSQTTGSEGRDIKESKTDNRKIFFPLSFLSSLILSLCQGRIMEPKHKKTKVIAMGYKPVKLMS